MRCLYSDLFIVELLIIVTKLSGGASLDANIALVLNNAKIGAQIARAYAHLRNSNLKSDLKGHYSMRSSLLGANAGAPRSDGPKVFVVGGLVIDHVSSPVRSNGENTVPLIKGTSNPGTTIQSFGGVGRNVAEAIVLSSSTEKSDVAMVSAVGTDAYGDSLLRHINELGIDSSKVQRCKEPSRTASYTAIHDHDGDLMVAVADMDVLYEISADAIEKSVAPALQSGKCKVIVSDGNINPAAFERLANLCHQFNVPLFFEPTSVHKCTVPIKAKVLHKVGGGIIVILVVDINLIYVSRRFIF